MKVITKSDFLKKYKLREDVKNSYVSPSSGSESSLASDLSNAASKNTTDDNFIVNTNSYDGNSSNDTVTLDVSGKNASDASKNYKKIVNNPNVKKLRASTNVNASIHLNNESINRLRESSVPFTKKEIIDMLKK